MQFNADGLKLIKDFEGCKLKAYKDMVGVLTIGYGDTQNVKSGMVITQAEADKRLTNSLTVFCDGVKKLITTKLTDNEFSALVCFAYNVGLHNLASSTLLRKVELADLSGAAEQFAKWDHAGGIEVPGLLRRRLAERALFLKS